MTLYTTKSPELSSIKSETFFMQIKKKQFGGQGTTGWKAEFDKTTSITNV